MGTNGDDLPPFVFKLGANVGTNWCGEKLLTARGVAAADPGRYGDGDGLYLEVSKAGTKRWMLRVQVNGRRQDFGLGARAGQPGGGTGQSR